MVDFLSGGKNRRAKTVWIEYTTTAPKEKASKPLHAVVHRCNVANDPGSKCSPRTSLSSRVGLSRLQPGLRSLVPIVRAAKKTQQIWTRGIEPLHLWPRITRVAGPAVTTAIA